MFWTRSWKRNGYCYIEPPNKSITITAFLIDSFSKWPQKKASFTKNSIAEISYIMVLDLDQRGLINGPHNINPVCPNNQPQAPRFLATQHQLTYMPYPSTTQIRFKQQCNKAKKTFFRSPNDRSPNSRRRWVHALKAVCGTRPGSLRWENIWLFSLMRKIIVKTP